MSKFNYSHILSTITLILAVLLCGCSTNDMFESDVRVNIRTRKDGHISRVYKSYNGIEIESVETGTARVISFNYEGKVNRGSLTIEWQDPDGRVVWRNYLTDSDSGTDEITIVLPGKFTIGIQGHDADGSFRSAWHLE